MPLPLSPDWYTGAPSLQLGSVTTMSDSGSGVVRDTVKSYVIVSPTCAFSGPVLVMSMPRSGQLTVIDASLESPGPLSIVTVAVLSICPQVVASVSDVMCTSYDVSAAMSPNWHVRTPCAMSHISAPVPPSIDQSRPALVGSVSETTTFFAVPGPALLTVMVNPTC